jgi:hypothetical protein
MAITITDSPYNLTPLNQKLIYMASSTNVANTGFRFQIEVTIGGDTHTFLVPPNTSSRMVFDIRDTIAGYFSPRLSPEDASQNSIQDLGMSDNTLVSYEDATTSTWIRKVDVTIKEGWIISGVFTPTAVGQATDSIVVWPARFFDDDFDQYQQDPAGFNDRILSGVISLKGLGTNFTPRVKKFPWLYGQGFTDSSVKIPVDNNSRYNIVFLLDDGTYASAATTIAGVKITVYEEDGTPNSATYSITDGPGRMAIFGCGPAQLNATTYVGFEKPSDYPNFRAYSIALVDSMGDQVGDPLLFVPVENYDSSGADCGTSRSLLKIAWVSADGGWDYFDFEHIPTRKMEMVRKRFQQVRGNYGSTTFDYATYDRGMTELDVETTMSYTAQTDYLDRGEVMLLGEMLRSKYVYLIQNTLGGNNLVPVIIDQSAYDEALTELATGQKFTFTFKSANKAW